MGFTCKKISNILFQIENHCHIHKITVRSLNVGKPIILKEFKLSMDICGKMYKKLLSHTQDF